MVKPLISVIVPVYNTQDYLSECIDSILAQVFKNYEIILVDDGSTDASAGICDDYASKYECITVIHKENKGIASARKAGLVQASGKYISYIDSDDSIESDMYKDMLGEAENYDADIVICDLISESRRQTILQKNIVAPGFYDKARLRKEFYPKMLFGGKNSIFGITPSLCNKIFKRDILEAAVMDTDDSISFGEDALCSFPCLLDAQRVCVIDKAYYHYRMVDSSITHIYDSELMYKFALLIELLDQAFEKRGFDGEWQLNHYAVKFSMECIRKELLFNKNLTLPDRIKAVNQYLLHPRIARAFEAVSRESFGRADSVKIKLITKRKIVLLYFSLIIKKMILKLQGKPFG